LRGIHGSPLEEQVQVLEEDEKEVDQWNFSPWPQKRSGILYMHANIHMTWDDLNVAKTYHAHQQKLYQFFKCLVMVHFTLSFLFKS
jgi:hypothetical protein